MVVLYLLGMDINTMTLGGQCIAFGSLVDDAIIDVENAYKRLRQNLDATCIIMVTFVPLFFLSGMEGRMLKPLGIAYIVALGMSLIVAMTVTPQQCRLMLTNENIWQGTSKTSVLREDSLRAMHIRWNGY